jgi:hypothetical protein
MTAPVSMIEREAYLQGFRSVWMRDESLFLPSSDWVREFAEGLPAALAPCGIDCDDYAIGAVHFANVALKRAGKLTGHSFGYAEVTIAPAYARLLPTTQFGKHACNVCRTLENEWLLIEPQTGRFEYLADARNLGFVTDLGRLFI